MFRIFINYLATLSLGRRVLWTYFIWYLFYVARYMELDVKPWLTAAGLSVLIGAALWINAAASGSRPVQLERWPIIRMFLFPFCVSSFSAMVKGRGFLFIFSPRLSENLAAAGCCLLPWFATFVARSLLPKIARHAFPLEPVEAVSEQG